MTKDDVLRLLLATMDDVGRVFDYSEIVSWPPGALMEFRQLGLIRPAQTSLTAACPNCDDSHIEPVVVVEESDGSSRYFIWCPESLRVEVTAEMVCGWAVDPDGVARAISAAMKLKAPQTLLPGRLWRLGHTQVRGSSRGILLATRLTDADAGIVAHRIARHGQPVVFVPHAVPEITLWVGRVPPVVPLSQVVSHQGNGVEVDTLAIKELVDAADAAAHTVGGLALSEGELKSMIRRQVKAERKGELADDAIIAAYQVHGNIYRAAEALEEDGFKIHPSTVARKVKAAREAGQIVETRDSASIRRSVASQHRNRSKKT